MYRTRLPQLDGGLFVTDGGLETTLIYHRGLELPDFAAFVLLNDDVGTSELRRYYEPYVRIARERRLGLVLDAPTWRANPRWAAKVGYDSEALDRLNRKAIDLMVDLRGAAVGAGPVVISGCVGPHDDGYSPVTLLGADEAAKYHEEQIATFAATEADMVTAMTMTYVEEAIGVARAAERHALPVAISFTVETDGRLPSGHDLGAAIEAVDAATGAAPGYYMINCAHPTHFATAVASGEPWVERIGGLRANASALSHEELDAAEELDMGDCDDLARRHAAVRDLLSNVAVLGGCCGTDHRHVEAICAAWGDLAARA